MTKEAPIAIVPAESAAPAPRPLKPLVRANLKLLETTNVSWRAVVPTGTTRQQLVLPDLWRSVGQDFHVFDHLHVVDEASTFYAHLLVVESHPGFVSVIELNYHPLPRMIAADGADVPPNFEIVHCGPEKLWTIKRNDGALYGEGFGSRADALNHLLNHAALR